MLAPPGDLRRAHPSFEITARNKQDFPLHWNFSRRTQVRNLHIAFRLQNVYGYITELCGQQAEVVQNQKGTNFHNVRKSKAQRRKHKTLQLGVFELRPFN
jgi:hypothetical protein